MSYTNTEKEFLYERKQLDVAYAIQKIFTAPREQIIDPAIPKISNFCTNLHELFYNEVLWQYNWRATGFTSSAIFLGYSRGDFTALQDYQSRFGKAFSIMNAELLPLRKKNNSNFNIQLELINSCLFYNIQKMCKVLPWHTLARNFLINEFSNEYEIRQEPLQLHSSGKLKIVSQLINAKNRIITIEKEREELKKANEILQQTIARTLNQHQDQMDEFKKILQKHEDQLNPSKKFDNIISSPSSPKQRFFCEPDVLNPNSPTKPDHKEPGINANGSLG